MNTALTSTLGPLVNPEEYAKAVLGYSRLPTGAGQNHISLGQFLTSNPASIDFRPQSFEHNFVTLYPLGPKEEASASPLLSPAAQQNPSDSDVDPDSADERRHDTRRFTSFHDPQQFFRHNLDQTQRQSCIIFLRGYMTAAWINNIGARYVVDPEFFCRHLDCRPADDNSNNFSIPALPSSSWHLIELPVITIGTRTVPKGPMRLDRIEALRKVGAEELKNHHFKIAKLSSSGMVLGESMVRDFYVFDETHFAVEQRISICMQTDDGGKTFSCKSPSFHPFNYLQAQVVFGRKS